MVQAPGEKTETKNPTFQVVPDDGVEDHHRAGLPRGSVHPQESPQVLIAAISVVEFGAGRGDQLRGRPPVSVQGGGEDPLEEVAE
jgi:hypothetical protein